MRQVTVSVSLAMLIAVAVAAAAGTDRDLVPESETWDLTPVYIDAAAWEQEYGVVLGLLDGYEHHRGTLAESTASLVAYLQFDDGVGKRLGRLELYAKLCRDLDLGDAISRGRWDRLQGLGQRVAEARAFADPEILAIPAEALVERMSEPELADHRPVLENLLEARDHVLGREQEEMLAAATGVCATPERIFHALAEQDLAYPTITGPDGASFLVDQSGFEAAKTALDRDFRARAHHGFFGAYAARRHSFAAVLDGQLKARIFAARVRRYDTAMAAALEPDAIPTTVYRNLVATVNENLAPLHRWMAFKKARLDVEELHEYDTAVTLFPEQKLTYSFAEARELITEALAPLGEQYGRDLQRAFDERWIDVHPATGKRQGAYSSGATYGVHPYVLINWNGEVTGLFELAHELGHALHAYYTVSTQPYPTADYTVFTAEVASATNEALLAGHLIDHAKSPAQELAFLEQSLNNIKLMFYWTTLLADLEMTVYDLAGQDVALTPEFLCALSGERFASYFGPAFTVDEADTYIWAALRHLYIVNFYLYKYATGFAAAEQLAADIRTDPGAAERYLDFLRCGNSRRPVEALRLAGVDMISTEPVVAVARNMTRMLDQIEDVAGTQGPSTAHR